MFKLRQCRHYRTPRYPCAVAGSDAPARSFLRNIARPALPIALSAALLPSLSDGFVNKGAEAAVLEETSGVQRPEHSQRRFSRLSLTEVEGLIGQLEEAEIREQRTFKGLSIASPSLLQGVEVHRILLKFMDKNGVGFNVATNADPREREIEKLQKGAVAHPTPISVRQVNSRATEATRVLLELERFLEWLDRNGMIARKETK